MASIRFYFLSAVMCCVLVACQSAVVTTEPTVKIDLPSKQETTDAPETTPAPETTTPPATTAAPDTTTKSTTTTSTPKTTTTLAPDTTTTPPPDTTTTTTPAPPAPTPAPPKPAPGPPEQGTWSYFDKNNNITCIVVQFAAQLNVTYPKTVNKTSSLGFLLVNVPANATNSTGACNATEQTLTITWPATVDEDNTLTVQFVKNETTKSYELKNLNVTLVPSIFPNISNVDSVDLYHGKEWPTPLATSYRCAAPTQLTLTSAEGINVAATLTLSHLQEEAFRTTTGQGFSAARDCAGGDIPDAVPIAVGCALGGMVLVVLIAYLVARHRSAARGYLSM